MSIDLYRELTHDEIFKLILGIVNENVQDLTLIERLYAALGDVLRAELEKL